MTQGITLAVKISPVDSCWSSAVQVAGSNLRQMYQPRLAPTLPGTPKRRGCSGCAPSNGRTAIVRMFFIAAPGWPLTPARRPLREMLVGLPVVQKISSFSRTAEGEVAHDLRRDIDPAEQFPLRAEDGEAALLRLGPLAIGHPEIARGIERASIASAAAEIVENLRRPSG